MVFPNIEPIIKPIWKHFSSMLKWNRFQIMGVKNNAQKNINFRASRLSQYSWHIYERHGSSGKHLCL